MATQVRVGIVSWNTRDLLRACLEALPKATEGLNADVVVVDNCSSDGSADLASSFPVSVVRNPTNLGYARAMNQALTVLSGLPAADVLIALNPDTVPPPGSLTSLVERLLEDDRAGLVAPRLVGPDGSRQNSAYRFPSLKLAAVVGLLPIRWQRGRLGARWLLETAEQPDREQNIDWAIGAVHVIRRDALNGEHPYNPRWFMYAEDLDLCWSLARSGWTTRFVPSVSVMHVGNASGSLAWGGGRTRRWLEASYDWYRLRHGPLAVRAWAVLNVLGVLSHSIGFMLSGSVKRSAHDRQLGRDLLSTLPQHARSMVLRPRPPGGTVEDSPERRRTTV